MISLQGGVCQPSEPRLIGTSPSKQNPHHQPRAPNRPWPAEAGGAAAVVVWAPTCLALCGLTAFALS